MLAQAGLSGGVNVAYTTRQHLLTGDVKGDEMKRIKDVARMLDTNQKQFVIDLIFSGDKEPLVDIIDPENPTARNIFYASTFIGISCTCGGFGFLDDGEIDDPIIEFTHEEWKSAVTKVIASIPDAVGRFKTVWVADDGLPF